MSFWTTSATSAQVNHAEALKLYKKLIEVEPNHPTLLYEAGLTAKALGDLKACIAYATDAVAIKRGLPSSLALLGSCQDDAGDSTAAVEAAAPLEDFTQVGLLQTFLYYVASLAKLDGSREWLAAHPAELEVLERAFRATKGK